MVQTVCAPARAQQLVNPYELYPYPLTLTNPSPNPHQIFPEILSEQCAMQEHRIVEEAGRNQMQVAMEHYTPHTTHTPHTHHTHRITAHTTHHTYCTHCTHDTLPHHTPHTR